MSVTLLESMGSDLSVVNAARVSFNKESEWEYEEDGVTDYAQPVLSVKDQKLIGYLAKHGHWTPFGHAFLSFRIKAPIFVARQLVKHQVGLCWNEVSRRYVDDEPEFWMPKVWRGKPVNAKQGSDGVVEPRWPVWQNSHDCFVKERAYYSITEACLYAYNDLLQQSVAPEQARMVLPLNTMTEWIWSGSLAAFARVVKLRTDPHAQAETHELASGIDAIVRLKEDFEHSWKALLGT